MVWDYMNLNSQNQFYFLFFTLLGHITSVNNVVVTVLYLLRALHQRIIVYRIVKKPTHTSECSYGHLRYKNQSDCLLSRSQGLIGL